MVSSLRAESHGYGVLKRSIEKEMKQHIRMCDLIIKHLYIAASPIGHTRHTCRYMVYKRGSRL